MQKDKCNLIMPYQKIHVDERGITLSNIATSKPNFSKINKSKHLKNISYFMKYKKAKL